MTEIKLPPVAKKGGRLYSLLAQRVLGTATEFRLKAVDSRSRIPLDPNGVPIGTPGVVETKIMKLPRFFEEIALLVESKQIQPEVAYYMFGYYARCAREGINFAEGIDVSPVHWGLFFRFTDAANAFADRHKDYPPALSL